MKRRTRILKRFGLAPKKQVELWHCLVANYIESRPWANNKDDAVRLRRLGEMTIFQVGRWLNKKVVSPKKKK